MEPVTPTGANDVVSTGMRALRTAAARVAAYYALTVVAALPPALLPAQPAVAVTVTVTATAVAAVLFVVLRAPATTPRVLAAAAATLAGMVALPVISPYVGTRDTQVLMGMFANGLGIGAAAAWGRHGGPE
jgi:hypothetical protein